MHESETTPQTYSQDVINAARKDSIKLQVNFCAIEITSIEKTHKEQCPAANHGEGVRVKRNWRKRSNIKPSPTATQR